MQQYRGGDFCKVVLKSSLFDVYFSQIPTCVFYLWPCTICLPLMLAIPCYVHLYIWLAALIWMLMSISSLLLFSFSSMCMSNLCGGSNFLILVLCPFFWPYSLVGNLLLSGWCWDDESFDVLEGSRPWTMECCVSLFLFSCSPQTRECCVSLFFLCMFTCIPYF